MTTLSFNLLWVDRGVARGLKALGDQTRVVDRQFAKMRGSSVAGMTAAHVAGGLILKGLTAAKNGLLAPINNASKFEKSMRLIGVTSGQSGQGLKDLTKLALDMGAKTSFSAQGASDAMLALAKGGMTAAQIKAGALQQTLTLATAGGLELGDAANFMVQGLSAFGLKAGQAGRVAAALAGGANASTASVQSMGLALSQVGAGAKTAGLSLEDTTAALAAFANAGVQGSDAGTALKTFLQRLVPVTDRAKGAMKDLGLITKDGKNEFFDASGKIKSMAEVSGILQKALQGQTREQKIATLTTIFGSDASRAAAILADEGAKGLAKYVKATSDKSAAEALAKNATLGYAGALERFKGSVETAGIQVGTKLLPVLSKLLDWMSGKALPALSQLAPAFTVLGSSLGTLGGVVKTVFKSIAAGFGLGQGSFQDFADFVSTHQEDITSAIITGGKAFVAFGTVLAKVVSGGLRAFGVLADGVGMQVSFIINGYAELARGAALAFGWIPGIGPKLIAADAKFAAFAKHAHDGIRTTGDAARGLADGIDKKLIPGLGKAGQGLDALGKKEIASARFRDIMAKAENRHRDALAAASTAAKTNGKTIDSNTVSGRANRAALINLVGTSQNYIGKLIATHASSKKVTAATQTARAEFVRVATSMGVSATKARKLADDYFKIPTKRSTKIDQPGMTNAQKQALRLYGDYEKFKNRTVTTKLKYNIPDQKLMNSLGVNIHVSKSGQGSGGGLARGGVLPGFTSLSRGDDVAFPMAGGGIQPLRGGEGIAVSEVMRDPHERALLLAKNKAALRGESMAKFRQAGLARGGFANTLRLPASTEGPNLGDVSAAFNRTNQEFGRNLGAKLAKAYNKRIDAAVKKLEASAGGGGGPIGKGGYASALSYARRHRGHPYIYGSLWDCSGFMSALHSIILGQSPHRRYTTTAFHGAHAAGFTRGKSSPFRVGVRPLSGKFGHMAGTLNGVNVESSGGVGVRVGGGARGAGSSMFSWRGGLAKGGVVGDLPFDLLDPRGERYNPWLADLVHKAGYHKGGRIGANGGPERVLSPPQNRAFENLAFARGGKGGGATYNVTINAPGYIGDKRALADVTVSVLTTLNRQGRLESIKR